MTVGLPSYLGVVLVLCAGSCRAEPPGAKAASVHSASSASIPTASPPTASSQSIAPVAPLDTQPFRTARRVANHLRAPRVTKVVLGERWGCAVFGTSVGSSVQCWDAPRKQGELVRPWPVPWLRDRSFEAGPARVLEFAKAQLTFRGWQRPRRGEIEGKKLAASEQWLNPNHANWEEAFERTDCVGKSFIGGTFSCLQATGGSGVWCLGDNRFGQLGGSRPVPPAHAEENDPAFVGKIWPAESVALGTWHACAAAAPQGLDFGGHIACWGRGDYGQLGVPAPDRCQVGGAQIACARTAQAGVRFRSAMLALAAGDLYTCVSTPDGMQCWGASRDGFFGTSAECPPRLRQAWPTLHGVVAAPNAKCSAKPVTVEGVPGFQQFPSAGPRGICFAENTPLHCVGGIRTPRASGITRVVVSPGEDASACGLQNGGVVCWGEGYSPAGAPDVLLPIPLELPTVPSEAAVIGTEDGSRYSASCQVRRGCDFGPAPLPTCASDLKVSDWSTLRATAEAHVGQTLNLRGAIAVGPGPHEYVSSLMDCHAPDGIACCGGSSHPVVLGAAPALRLERLFCAGDDSEACCNAPAYGDTLIASGRLEPDQAEHDAELSGYMLTSVTLCKPNSR